MALQSRTHNPIFTYFSGENATLPCLGPTAPPIAMLDWSRPELKNDGYVFFYRDGKVFESYQHQIYRGRVELQDPHMSAGNMSIIVKNVNVNDSGVYECELTLDTGPGPKPQRRYRVRLEVKEMPKVATEAQNESSNSGVMAPVTVGLVVLVIVCIISIYFMYKCKMSKSAPSDPESASPLHGLRPVENC